MADPLRGLICQFETFFDPFEASLMVVEALAHGCHVSVDQRQVPPQARDMFFK